MTDNKRKKTSRAKGNTTQGFGSMKKNRGAGNRGGRGNAGSGKRGDQKAQIYRKNKKYFGKHGFKKKGNIESISPLNIIDLNQKADSLVSTKKMSVEGDVFVINLGDIGINKLLGKGTPDRKYKITVKYASEKAIEKIKSTGDIVIENVAVEHNKDESA